MSYSWFQTSQTRGQRYSDTSPFSIPWFNRQFQVTAKQTTLRWFLNCCSSNCRRAYIDYILRSYSIFISFRDFFSAALYSCCRSVDKMTAPISGLCKQVSIFRLNQLIGGKSDLVPIYSGHVIQWNWLYACFGSLVTGTNIAHHFDVWRRFETNQKCHSQLYKCILFSHNVLLQCCRWH